ncbi:MAG TPA: MraY family glycosyltransferase [Solirubrobacteraceae bacterium]|nr:MraY family glycosyltransferase [Solirubrobacteraceae bacterium]
MKDDAFLGFLVALAVATALTPPVARLARRIGAVDGLKERGLAREATPLLGGLAVFAGVLIAAALFVAQTTETRGILAGAALITAVGALDDWRELSPVTKLLGQIAAALVLVASGVSVDDVTLPFVHRIDFGAAGGPLTMLGIVALMNVVNFSDGVDGLAAGVCAVSAAAFAVIAFDLGRQTAGVLAAIVCGASLGFLVHNFHPASVFMGDCGSNLLGLLLGAIIVEGSLKTNALVALIVPLVVLAVPFLDTGFVVAKRIKYRRPVYQGDSNHFHHRFHRIGFSQRRTVLYLYAWTVTMASLAVAVRFVPYTDDRGNWDLEWSLVLAACFAVAFAASVYLVLVLEILKLRRLRAWQLRRLDPDTSEHEIDKEVERELETGEFRALEPK